MLHGRDHFPRRNEPTRELAVPRAPDGGYRADRVAITGQNSSPPPPRTKCPCRRRPDRPTMVILFRAAWPSCHSPVLPEDPWATTPMTTDWRRPGASWARPARRRSRSSGPSCCWINRRGYPRAGAGMRMKPVQPADIISAAPRKLPSWAAWLAVVMLLAAALARSITVAVHYRDEVLALRRQ